MPIAHNPNVPNIPPPFSQLDSLTSVCELLRQGVESLGGQRGGQYDRAVTLSDLVVLGLVTEAQLQTILGRTLPRITRG